MLTPLTFSAEFERPAVVPGTGRDVSPSDADLRLELRRVGAVDRPVDLARCFKRHGLSLRAAHAALNVLVADERIRLAVRATLPEFAAELEALGVQARPPDSQPALAAPQSHM